MQLFWRDDATGEIIVRMGRDGGLPLFGCVLPFLGWKWIPCDANGDHVQCEDFGAPTHVRLVIGMSWLGHGLYWFPYSNVGVRKVA